MTDTQFCVHVQVHKFKLPLLSTFQNIVSYKGFIVHLSASAHMFLLHALGWYPYRTG